MCCTWLCFAKTKIVFIRPIKRSNSNSLTFNNRANNKDKGHLQWDRWVIVIHYSHVWPPLHWKFCMYAFMLCCLFFCVACSDFSMSSFEFKNHSWIQMWIRMNSYSHWMNSYRVKIFTVGKILVQIREFQLFWTYAKKKNSFIRFHRIIRIGEWFSIIRIHLIKKINLTTTSYKYWPHSRQRCYLQHKFIPKQTNSMSSGCAECES